jgi:hypothetical protein
MNNYQRIERVRYSPNAHLPKGTNLANAHVHARSHIYPESSPFRVLFNSGAFFSRIGCDSFHDYFPSAQIDYGSYHRHVRGDCLKVVGSADITIYIDGALVSPQGVQEQRKFQFDFRVRIMCGPDGESIQGLSIGQLDVSCFDLALHTSESSLVLRPDNPHATTGFMRLC